MSKAFLLSCLVLLVSCQPAPKAEPQDLLGEVRSLDPVRRPEDNEMVSKICAALKAKQSMLGVLVSQQYTFEQSKKDCAAAALTASRSIVTRIKRTTGDSYFFEGINEDFGFSNIETATDGIMKSLCQKDPYYLESPVVDEASNTAIYWTTVTDPEICKRGYDVLCIHLQVASLKDSYTAKIHTNEWIKFKTADSRVGFFTERYMVTNSGCSKRQNRQVRAILK